MLEELKSHLIFKNGVVKPDDALFLKLKSYKLSENRLAHSQRVADLCYKVAISNRLSDPIKYYISGLLHDIGKGFSDDEALKIIKNVYKEVPKVESFAYHAFVGAYLASADFRVESSEILEAIKYHCTGYKELSSVGKVLYACDKIEPGRGYDSDYMINSMLSDFEGGFKLVLHENLIFLSKKANLSPLMFLEKTNYLSKECFLRYLDINEFK